MLSVRSSHSCALSVSPALCFPRVSVCFPPSALHLVQQLVKNLFNVNVIVMHAKLDMQYLSTNMQTYKVHAFHDCAELVYAYPKYIYT